MTIEGILKEIRRRLGDVDGLLDEVNLDYSDDYIFEYIASAIDYITVTMPADQFTYSFSGSTVSPEPETIDGLLIAALAAKMIIRNDVLHKVKNGEFGIRFKSGLDEISTIEAGKLIRGSVTGIEEDYRSLVMAKLSGNTAGATRLQ